MNKFLMAAAMFGFAAFLFTSNPAKAEDTGSEDAYNDAYAACAEKADNVEGDYDTIFRDCMKEKGFPIGENKGSDASPEAAPAE